MHDAVHADVLESLTFGGAQHQVTVRGLEEHSQNLTADPAAVVQTNAPAAASVAVTAVTPAMDGCLQAAQRIIAQAGQDPQGALTVCPAFLVAFPTVEVQLPRVGATLSVRAQSVTAIADMRRTSTTRVVVGTGLAGAVTLALLGRLAARSVTGPLRLTVEALEGLAEGCLDAPLDGVARNGVGQMAAALNRAMVTLRTAISAMGEADVCLDPGERQELGPAQRAWRRGPARRARVSRLSRARSRTWRARHRGLPTTSGAGSTRSVRIPGQRWRRSTRSPGSSSRSTTPGRRPPRRSRERPRPPTR